MTTPEDNNYQGSPLYQGIKPDYYTSNGLDLFDRFEGGLMPINQVQGFYIGNIIKYVTRYQGKNGVEDLNKAATYLQQLIDFEKRLKNETPTYNSQDGGHNDN